MIVLVLLMSVNWDRFKVFETIYRLGSLSAAAKELLISQGGVSQHLKQLERELGAQLFIRTRREAISTEVSKTLYPVVQNFLSGLSEVSAHIQLNRGKPTGVLRVAAPLEFSHWVLPPVLSVYRQKYPLVSVELTTSNIPYRTLERLQKNEIDFAFIDAADLFLRLFPVEGKTIMMERQVLVSSNRVEAWSQNTYEDLSRGTFVSHVKEGTEIKFWFKHQFKRVPIKVAVSLSVDSVRGIIEAVKAGLGYGLVPLYLIKEDLANGKLKIIPGPKRKPYENRIAVAQIPGKKPSFTEKAFEATFREIYPDVIRY